MAGAVLLMTDDIFLNRMGGFFDVGSALVRHINASELSMERIVSAYRQNVALPDVHIADRESEFEPVVVAEDGEELTPERRVQLMREAGVKPMFDEQGKPTDQTYLGVFDDLIDQERMGKTAEENRPGYRVVQPRELELEYDIDEWSVANAKPIKEDHAE